jgi:hypothetical protein
MGVDDATTFAVVRRILFTSEKPRQRDHRKRL